MDDKEVKELAEIIRKNVRIECDMAWNALDGDNDEDIAKAILEAGYVKPQPSLKFERIKDEEIKGICKKLTEACKKDSDKVNGIEEATYALVSMLLDAQALSDEKQLAQHLAGIGKDIKDIVCGSCVLERICTEERKPANCNLQQLSALILVQKKETAREKHDNN